MLLPMSDLTAGEAYIHDDIDIVGDISSVLEFGRGLTESSLGVSASVELYWLLRQLPNEPRRGEAERPRMQGAQHSIRRDRDAVAYHYDVGNAFFAQFLDSRMVYYSAAFLSPADTL